MVKIRAAKTEDLESIRGIYNEAILHTTATFDTEVRTPEKQHAWFHAHKKNHPVLVAEELDKVVGWASLSEWSDRCAYDGTVEVSVYIHHECRGRGLGGLLLEAVTREGQRLGNHSVIARITQGNDASIHLHEKNGYSHVGVLREVGFKFGRYLDVHMMQRIYKN